MCIKSSLVTADKPKGKLWPKDHATAILLFHNITKEERENYVSAMLLLPTSGN
jgi:hypothetical protein